MKNWDFHEEELKKYGFAFGMRNNQIDWCSKVSCSKCEFHVNGIESCSGAKIEWLYQEHKDPVVLTDDEKALCKLLGRGWIARERNGELWWYEAKPVEKKSFTWSASGVGLNVMIENIFPQCKFNFIKWEDEEPWEVKIDD